MKVQPKLGKLLAKHRKEKNMTQERLAFVCDLHPDYIGKMEQGKRIPSLIVVFKILNSLKINYSEFFSEFD